MMTDPMMENATVESLFPTFDNAGDSFVPSGFDLMVNDILGFPMDDGLKTMPTTTGPVSSVPSTTVPFVGIKLEQLPLGGNWMERTANLAGFDAEALMMPSPQTASVPQSPLPDEDGSESLYGDASLSSRGRRSGKRPLDTEDDKLANKRMRNRLAAQKCRMKKAQESHGLEQRAVELKKENADLRDRLGKMQAEVEYLRNLIKLAVRPKD
eukprot:Opistho-2@29895